MAYNFATTSLTAMLFVIIASFANGERLVTLKVLYHNTLT